MIHDDERRVYGPGTPSYRLDRLLDNLDKLFPGLVSPIASDPPEPKYLAAIKALQEALKDKTDGST